MRERPGVPHVGVSSAVITLDAPVAVSRDSPGATGKGWTFAQQETERYIEQIRAFSSRCPQGAPLLIKDARIIALFDFWLQATRAEEFRLKVIVPVRNPIEVAASLHGVT